MEGTEVAQTAPAEPAAPPKSLLARIVGVILSPGATYASVAARPRVLGVLLFVATVSAVCVGTFAATEVGQQALMEQQQRQMQSFGVQLTDAQLQQMEARMRFAKYFG